MPSVTELRDELWPCFNGTVYEASTKGPFTSATVDEKECRNRFESAVLAIGGMKVNQGLTRVQERVARDVKVVTIDD